ncbi:hypothetical protein J3Q64DRAFT_1862944 [Phycomyces blakesleeanus]|uniref:DH domain-containing protein n=2 Tax=Phycomyces blakesleeanus TaxID=4837 RepID=A0A167MSN3_PHYB8|nr:hypothetical protein PHYBLDRAFT_168240 [Phycomyces blakesleeanus NRRL 1555(-)]OAD73809.1 hypothetical protein PHYBLDRAFT_168240 [Phycomyces blakesleeanus NRRL 1555(-)]|eukprot:XP_018291849.1 hypothetical protein PHYBLDRAFT_168240 [Phycomyces blakesleeanus NRRL 1555(-)]
MTKELDDHQENSPNEDTEIKGKTPSKENIEEWATFDQELQAFDSNISSHSEYLSASSQSNTDQYQSSYNFLQPSPDNESPKNVASDRHLDVQHSSPAPSQIPQIKPRNPLRIDTSRAGVPRINAVRADVALNRSESDPTDRKGKRPLRQVLNWAPSGSNPIKHRIPSVTSNPLTSGPYSNLCASQNDSDALARQARIRKAHMASAAAECMVAAAKVAKARKIHAAADPSSVSSPRKNNSLQEVPSGSQSVAEVPEWSDSDTVTDSKTNSLESSPIHTPRQDDTLPKSPVSDTHGTLEIPVESYFEFSPEALGQAIVMEVDNRTIQRIVDRVLADAALRYSSEPKEIVVDKSVAFIDPVDKQVEETHQKCEVSESPKEMLEVFDLSPSKDPISTSEACDTNTIGVVKPSNISQHNKGNSVRSHSSQVSNENPKLLRNSGSTNSGTKVPSPQEKVEEIKENDEATLLKMAFESARTNKRMSAIKELLETEESYAKKLSNYVRHFLFPIQQKNNIPDDKKQILLRNCSQIHRFEEDFLVALQSAHMTKQSTLNGHIHTGNIIAIARCFIEWGPRFEVYIEYCVNHDDAYLLYKELLETSDDFSKMMAQLHAKNPVAFRGSRLTMTDYMMMPIQRLLRYRILLQTITKATQKDTVEYEELSKAQDAMHKIASRIDDEKARVQAVKKTGMFLSRIESDSSLPERWYNALGVCVLIGTLEVRSDTNSMRIKRLGCALFDNYMIIVKGKKPKRYQLQYWFPLRIFTVDPNGGLDHGWTMLSDRYTFDFGSVCEQERIIWVEALGKTIEQSKVRYEQLQEEDCLEHLFGSSFDIERPLHRRASTVHSSNSFASISSLASHKSHKSLSEAARMEADTILHSTIDETSIKSHSSFHDIQEFFANSVSGKWGYSKQVQVTQNQQAIDHRFEDVCTTPLLKARCQAIQDRASTFSSWRHRSYVSKTPSVLSFRHIEENGYFGSASSSVTSSPHPLPSSNRATPVATSPQYRNFGDGLMSAIQRKTSLPIRPSVSTPKEKKMGHRQAMPPPPTPQRPQAIQNVSLPCAYDDENSLEKASQKKSMIFKLSQRPQKPVERSGGDKESSGMSRVPSAIFGKLAVRLGNLGAPLRQRSHASSSTTSVNVMALSLSSSECLEHTEGDNSGSFEKKKQRLSRLALSSRSSTMEQKASSSTKSVISQATGHSGLPPLPSSNTSLKLSVESRRSSKSGIVSSPDIQETGSTRAESCESGSSSNSLPITNTTEPRRFKNLRTRLFEFASPLQKRNKPS